MTQNTGIFISGINKIRDGQYFEGFAQIADEFNRGNYSDEVLEMLYQCFTEPNLSEIVSQYEANVELLNKYPYLFDKEFVEPADNRYKLFPVTAEKFFIYDTIEKQFEGIVVGSEVEREYLLAELSEPIRLTEEWNVFHIQFLIDNLRDSKAFGGDNHLYLCFDSMDRFSLLLQYCDMEKLCEKDKLVILIGEDDKSRYPFDPEFFGEDYAESKPVTLDEIKRIFVFWSTNDHCGNAFIDSIMDCHPNLLTIKEFGLSAFASFYEECLKNTSVNEFLDGFLADQLNPKYRVMLTFFNKIYPNCDSRIPDAKSFIHALKDILADYDLPTKRQWFIALFMANSAALGRDMNSRIAPAVFHAPHVVWGCDWNEEMGAMKDLYESFPYCKVFSLLRRPEAMIAGSVKYEMKCRELYGMAGRDPISMIVKDTGAMRNVDWRRIFHDESSFFPYDKMLIVKYEDIKLYPEKTLASFCEYLNIPWSDSLMSCTYNGAKIVYRDAGTTMSDFDVAPLSPDYYSKYLNSFDMFRLELLYYQLYSRFGYRCRYYNGFPYSNNEIIAMFEIPFEFEGPSCDWDSAHISARKEMMHELNKYLQYHQYQIGRIKTGKSMPCRVLQ